MNWRETDADALDDKVAVHAITLAGMAESYAIAERDGNDALCQELRSVASALRADAAEKVGQARGLRAAHENEDRPLLSSALTSHYARNVRPLRAGGE